MKYDEILSFGDVFLFQKLTYFASKDRVVWAQIIFEAANWPVW